MPFNTLTVAAATTPTVLATFFSHYLNKPSAHTPAAHISYHEGVALVRRFLEYASHHTVEQLQAFTAQYVPHPTWVHTEDTDIPQAYIDRAAVHVIAQLGPATVAQIGGSKWWQWRERPLMGEWIEMRKHYNHRLKHPKRSVRTMLYVHGGAYYFGSVDEHRYQMQRHARKLKGRVFAPRYRLAPQFPFPCAIHDVLSCYLYLLEIQKDPSTIIFVGDSAGGGLILSLLTILRDQGIPLPAGAILISPWVDLCHSFPSVVADNNKDYIPAHGFQHRPSATWPPPTSADLKTLRAALASSPKSAVDALQRPTSKAEDEHESQGFITRPTAAPSTISTKPKHNTSVVINNEVVTLTDQIQMYTTNNMLAHPLVSPVNQGSLGGLPPLLVLVGGGEVLRDEQIYIAHKAADPQRFQPWEGYLEEDERQKEAVGKWQPTKVMLQVYDDCCHVIPTLSFTRPAKYMYRSIAQFGKWCLANAKRDGSSCTSSNSESISISSNSSSSSSTSSSSSSLTTKKKHGKHVKNTVMPPFDDITNMIRQRVSPDTGEIFDLPPIPPPDFVSAANDTSSTTAVEERKDTSTAPPPPPEGIHPYNLPLTLPRAHIGTIKPVPTMRWMEAKKLWDVKYAKQKRAVQKGWLEVMYLHEQKKNEKKMQGESNTSVKDGKRISDGDASTVFGDGNEEREEEDEENIPPTALYRRMKMQSKQARIMAEWEKKKIEKKGWSLGLGFWTWMGEGHDRTTIVRSKTQKAEDKTDAKKEEKLDKLERKRRDSEANTAKLEVKKVDDDKDLSVTEVNASSTSSSHLVGR